MGEFSAGRWILGLTIYFFAFFLIVYSSLNALIAYGADTQGVNVQDPGFLNANNIPWAQTGECKGSPYYWCDSIGSTDNQSCQTFAGCYWGSNLFSDDSCKGVYLGACHRITDIGNCTVVGCTWSDFTGVGAAPATGVVDNNFDWSAVKDTIGFMTGFNAELGAPAYLRWIIAFIFFYIPGLMLIWALYMALPVIH